MNKHVIVWGWDAGGVCGRVTDSYEAERSNVRLKVHGYRRGAPQHMVKIEIFDCDTLLRSDEVSSLLIRFEPELCFSDVKKYQEFVTDPIESIKQAALTD